MSELDTHRTNAEARADVAARGPREAVDTALLRYLAAAAYREAAGANHEHEEATDESPTGTGEPGAEHR